MHTDVDKGDVIVAAGVMLFKFALRALLIPIIEFTKRFLHTSHLLCPWPTDCLCAFDSDIVMFEFGVDKIESGLSPRPGG